MTDSIANRIARAIVHLNFDEPEQAKEVLLDALTDFNFPQTATPTQSQSAAKEAA
jgi:hypothetical protein